MIETDDEMFRVDNHYLGPAGKTLPKPVRYKAVGFGVLIALAMFVVLFSLLGLPVNTWTLITLWGPSVYWLTRRFLDYLGHERTVRSVFRSAANDLTSPRPMSAKDAARAAEKARSHTVSVSEQLTRIRLHDSHFSSDDPASESSTSEKVLMR